MKKLANFKNISSTDANNSSTSKRNGHALKAHSKKKHNSPYMGGTLINGNSASQVHGHNSLSTVPTRRTASVSSNYPGESSFQSSIDDIAPQTIDYTSTAATVSTERDAALSVAAPSHAASSGEGTTTTIGPSTTLGASSTFSSPAPSLRSLTTTLTTMHSTGAALNVPTPHTHTHGPAQSIHFTHQFPTSPPPSALPSHLVPQASSGGHPATYTTATANNLLTDNASILTLASSSKRRRRRSMDTDASVRALAPSSLFGGSRESLPLSVLSSTIDASASALQQRIGNERASIYSATGVAPALPSERNSFYAGGGAKLAGDAGSMNSGRVGHGREGSVSGSLSGMQGVGSPLAGGKEREREAVQGGKLSRTNSGWEGADGEEKGEEGEKGKGKGKGKGKEKA